MATYDDLHQKVSQNMLERLLGIHGEAANLDFKQFYSLKTPKDKAELVRDTLHVCAGWDVNIHQRRLEYCLHLNRNASRG